MRLLAYVIAEVGDIQQFFQKAHDEIEHGIAPGVGWGGGGDGPAVAALLRTSARRRYTIIEAGRV